MVSWFRKVSKVRAQHERGTAAVESSVVLLLSLMMGLPAIELLGAVHSFLQIEHAAQNTALRTASAYSIRNRSVESADVVRWTEKALELNETTPEAIKAKVEQEAVTDAAVPKVVLEIMNVALGTARESAPKERRISYSLDQPKPCVPTGEGIVGVTNVRRGGPGKIRFEIINAIPLPPFLRLFFFGADVCGLHLKREIRVDTR